MPSNLLYIDSSAFLRRLLRHDGAQAVEAALIRHASSDGARVVSSRLLWLEARRVAVRLRAESGTDISEAVTANLNTVDLLPLSEEVWDEAHGIEQHIKTLDSLHLATCKLVEADLLTLDASMARVAAGLGIGLVPPTADQH